MDILKNDKINEVLKLLEMKCYKDREIQEMTGISKGSLYRIKQGKIKPNRKDRKESFNLDSQYSKENYIIFKDTNFGKGLMKIINAQFNKQKKEIKDLRNELEKLKSQMVNDPKQPAPKKPKKLSIMNAFDNNKE